MIDILKKTARTFPTYLKYFLSYFTIFSVLILGFFFIVRSTISKRYLEQLSQQALSQTSKLAAELTDDLLFLEQINSSLQSNIELIYSRYSPSGWQSYQARQELLKYDSANQMINNICYTNKSSGEVTTIDKYAIYYKDDVFQIIDNNDSSLFLTFDPAPYYNASSGQIVFLSNAGMQYLIYFPAQRSSLDYVSFFRIDTNEIRNYLDKNISDTIPAMILVDEKCQVVTGVNAGLLTPHLESLSIQNGIFQIDSDSSLCIRTGIPGGFSLISLISNTTLNRQLDSAFASTYLLLFLLGCVGFLLVLFAMQITYLPLRRLTQKIVSDPSSRQGYLEQLDDAFTAAQEQTLLLEKKLKNYQISMKKSLLDSVIESSYSAIHTPLPNIDQLFDLESPKELFAIQIRSPQKVFPYHLIQNLFQETLPGKDSCIVLKMNTNSALFLINFTGTNPDKKEILLDFLQDLHQKHGCLSAISNGSESPLDIPALCESAVQASCFWPEIPVADCQLLPSMNTAFTYPYDQLGQLAEMLQNLDFGNARKVLKDILRIINSSSQDDEPLSDLFTHGVLVDLITTIISYMIHAKIAYKVYEDLYQETLYFCRSCPYAETADAIESNIFRLLDICQQEAGSQITSSQIRQLIEENYCQPNFSIYELADQLQISFTYASNLIKRKLNQNFSDYLWTLRLEKAKELLMQTDLSIDEISTAVGYVNTSSFRRKFKQETGLTPSEFRSEKHT